MHPFFMAADSMPNLRCFLTGQACRAVTKQLADSPWQPTLKAMS